ncbi:alanine/glycine:cation symporter family protein [Mangrovibacillus cuniculi]|uniref:Alanine:cation symporter family protein n=1 Tax=Mangrovibacillus cuniculi TaxID=2593652 RepID=A0A7S8CAM6_9BACI|nr:alanine/glycine:cation symporter family protein [Mangrovibacillus cuniculi]QPC46486.1 alanine:cation symporter family protein [Mangrovibacillus cuniculi]
MFFSSITFAERINNFVNVANDQLWGWVLIYVLIGAGLYFTISTKFVQFRYIKEMFGLLTEKETLSTEGKKTISSFQAFTISAASRVGTGNLAGVATAIAGGGPGAVFWMWIIALIGSASAFIESTLAQIYKVKDDSGAFRGGPAYYMEKGLNKRWLGIIFAVIIMICFGLIFNSIQSNTIALAMEEAAGVQPELVGIVLAVITGIVIFGGIHRIAILSQAIVPVMAIIYILVAIFVLLTNITQIPAMISLIVESAFGLREVVSGGMGAAIMFGIKRGLFSNEAGMGSAPNAAATATVSHPAKQGFIQSLGVFFDTILICSATAFIIILSGVYTNPELDGIQLTQNALGEFVGAVGAPFLAVLIFLFAFSSIVGNYYYGETNLEFIRNNKVALTLYRLAVIGMVYYGTTQPLQSVWNMGDLFMAIMALINILAIVLLGRIAIAALKDYTNQRKQGKNPVFYADSIPNLPNVEAWEKKPTSQK